MNEIVVGVDGSPESIAALAWAEANADADATVRAVHAWEYPVTAGVTPEGSGFSLPIPYEDLQQLAERRLADALAAVPEGRGTRIPEVLMGSPAAALVGASRGAQLLVVGTRGHSTTTRLLVGSVALQCAHHAECPMVAVPAGAAPQVDRVVAATDGSDDALVALRWAAAWAEHHAAQLRIVSVWDRGGWNAGGTVTLTDAQLVERAEAWLATHVREALGPDAADAADIRAVRGGGEIVPALLEQTGDAGLLVVGSRGHGGFAGLLLGSVSQRCLEQATVPVAVIRPDVA